MNKETAGPWDAIVIGSGIGGLACAAALAHTGHRVLVLEQHYAPGGLTQTFSREGYTWDVGVHYLGDMGPGGAAGAILDWLSDGAIQMAPVDAVYDTAHFPDGFEMQFSRPETALTLDLKEKFPGCEGEIDTFFEALREAERAGMAVFAQRAMPSLLGRFYGQWHHGDVERWWGRTTAEVAAATISEPRLRSILMARWGTHGGRPAEASFGIHATVMRHYFRGAYYPLGGAKTFADKLVPVVERHGGHVRTRAHATEVLVEEDRVAGVRLADGEMIRAPAVFSDIGAYNTVGRLLPEGLRGSEWARDVLSLRPSVCHVALYLGLEGDVRANGATPANHWIYETWDMDAALWRDPAVQPVPPAVFVSFPSLKDLHHHPGRGDKHTAEVIALTTWDAFSRWESSDLRNRPVEYLAFKELIERNLLTHFCRYFPALGPMIRYHELSTPLSTVAFTGAAQGAIYGLEVTPRRFLSPSLSAKTPVPGLYLTGQDVASPGVTGAMMGGVLAAAAIEPRIFKHVG